MRTYLPSTHDILPFYGSDVWWLCQEGNEKHGTQGSPLLPSSAVMSQEELTAARLSFSLFAPSASADIQPLRTSPIMGLIAQQASASWEHGLASLGKFAELPYEVREMIWVELSPTGQDVGFERKQKSGLGILRASRWLYEEISRLIYQDSTLQFDFASNPNSGVPWGTVYFTNKSQKRMGLPTTWIFETFTDACNRGFTRLPYHKFQSITVNLYPTVPRRWGFARLWAKTSQFVKWLEGAVYVQRLIIRLVERDGRDWLDESKSLNRCCVRKYDHEIVLEPFWTLRNLGALDILAHTNELRKKINWTPIHRHISVCLCTANLAFARDVNREHASLALDYDEKMESDLQDAITTYPLEHSPDEMCSRIDVASAN